MDLLERQHARHRSNMGGEHARARAKPASRTCWEKRAQESWRNIDAALDPCFSVDSRAFLAATTQYGGQ